MSMDHSALQPDCTRIRTEFSPLLLICLCSQSYFDRVVDHEVHELVESLEPGAHMISSMQQISDRDAISFNLP